MDIKERTRWIKSLALEAGFLHVGISKAEFIGASYQQQLEEWLRNGYQGKMQYLENYKEKRLDPTQLVPGAKSIISLAYNYYTTKQPLNPEAPKVATYAYGKDYHFVIKRKMHQLLERIRDELGAVEGRYFVDSAPVLERQWAARSGLGWQGKHTLLIHPKHGSYFFLAELILDVELVPDEAIQDHCGRCRRCIDACPTGAIADMGYVVDGSRCISYATIELKPQEDIPAAFENKMEGWVFGCDICQQVCPWNRFASPHDEPYFEPKEGGFLEWTVADWVAMDKPTFKSQFKGTPLERAKYEGIKRNVSFLFQNKAEKSESTPTPQSHRTVSPDNLGDGPLSR